MSGEHTEGFICPYCLVGFVSASKLQSHFLDMHSGQGFVDEPDSPEEVEVCVCVHV